MARCSSCILFTFNLLLIVISIPMIIIASSMYRHPKITSCDKYQAPEVMTVGIFLLVLAIIWFMGAFCRMKLFLWLYMLAMVFTMIGLLAYSLRGLFSIYTKGEIFAKIILQKQLEDYRVDDFSYWMRRHVDKDSWVEHRTCLVDSNYCKGIDASFNYLSPQKYMTRYPTQWGCCKPPRQCGYEGINATFWEIPKSGLAPTKDHDCLTYSNHQETMCYDCETCKIGFLASLRVQLKRLFFVNIFISIFLLIISCVACCNIRSKRKPEQYAGYGNQMP